MTFEDNSWEGTMNYGIVTLNSRYAPNAEEKKTLSVC